jgi:cell division protein FtsB
VTGKKSGDWKRKAVVGAFVFLLFILLLTSFFGKKGLLEIFHARKTYATLLRDIETLKQEKTRLEKEVAGLERNPGAVDKEAREKLWLMKPDEKVIIKK